MKLCDPGWHCGDFAEGAYGCCDCEAAHFDGCAMAGKSPTRYDGPLLCDCDARLRAGEVPIYYSEEVQR